MSLPDWRLPPGVPRGVWDYTRSRGVADDYDAYHATNPLFGCEDTLLAETFGEPEASAPGVIADLGCGSGRALLPLVRRGWRGLAVDLSPAMLAVVREKAEAEGLAIECVEANLVELSASLVPDASVDHAICLFSTLGMIRGRQNRRAALAHMRRILKPSGRLVLHAHNLWWNLRDPGGPWWVIVGGLRSLTVAARTVLGGGAVDAPEWGDKVYPYRGVPNFFLHVFRKSELAADLRAAGFQSLDWRPLDYHFGAPLARPGLFPALRAGGWLVVCK